MATLEVYNNQTEEVIPNDLLERFLRCGKLALPLAIEHPAHGGGVLADLDEVEISIVSDEVIAQVHQDFMDIPGATDVITFEHGEIVISAQTARAYAAHYENSFEKELMLYIIHGLLHLAGHEDADSEERELMEAIQVQILEQVWIA
ncbi:MAG: putative rRNA maturation factor [Cryomorphaceae bacterium]|jgi:probable rRNA maturation factor